MSWLKQYCNFCLLALKELFPSKRRKLLKAILTVLGFIAFVVVSDYLGIPLHNALKPVYGLLTVQVWIMIILGAVIFFLLFLIDGARRYHDRTISEINEAHKSTLREIEKERDSVELQIWNRARILDKLCTVAGHASEIDILFDRGEDIPLKVLERWAVQLSSTLYSCFGESGVTMFYRGREDKVKVPDNPERRHTWFYGHRERLAEIIVEQHHATTIVRKEGKPS